MKWLYIVRVKSSELDFYTIFDDEQRALNFMIGFGQYATCKKCHWQLLENHEF